MKDMKKIQNSLETPCQVCGSVGFASLMLTCFQCTETQEHTYCARVPLPSVPDIWLCEECRPSVGRTQIMVVAEKYTTVALATNTTKKGSDCASRPAKSSHPSGKYSCETSKLGTDSAEEIAEMSTSTKEAKLSTPVNVVSTKEAKRSTPVNVVSANGNSVQNFARDSDSGISANGSLGCQLSQGHISKTQTFPDGREACVVSKEQRPFEAFPPPKRKRRTLRLTVNPTDMNVKTIA